MRVEHGKSADREMLHFTARAHSIQLNMDSNIDYQACTSCGEAEILQLKSHSTDRRGRWAKEPASAGRGSNMDLPIGCLYSLVCYRSVDGRFLEQLSH